MESSKPQVSRTMTPEDVVDWQIRATKDALERADSPNAKFIDHEKVVAWLATWGTSNERPRPR